MRQSAFRTQQATPAQGFTGGMAEQGRQALSAAEISQMGAVGRSREQALRDIRTGRQSAFSNALIAGQQQSDYARMLQDASFQRQSQIENILTNDETDNDAKRRLLTSLGLSKEVIEGLMKDAEAQNRGISRQTGGLTTVGGNIYRYGTMAESLQAREDEEEPN
jgi:hypothetical protein